MKARHTKQQVERLSHVIRILENLPSGKRFSLATWMTCGTQACAVGWAATDPWFKRRGFTLDSHIPKYKDDLGWNAVNSFFHLSDDDAYYLFNMEAYHYTLVRSRHHVICRIRKFIKERS